MKQEKVRNVWMNYHCSCCKGHVVPDNMISHVEAMNAPICWCVWVGSGVDECPAHPGGRDDK